MLELAIIVLLGGTAYSVYIAPKEEKLKVALVLIVLAAAGYAGGYALTDKGTDQRDYYPIAGAIGGAMIAFGWISHRQKSWPKKDAKS